MRMAQTKKYFASKSELEILEMYCSQSSYTTSISEWPHKKTNSIHFSLLISYQAIELVQKSVKIFLVLCYENLSVKLCSM